MIESSKFNNTITFPTNSHDLIIVLDENERVEFIISDDVVQINTKDKIKVEYGNLSYNTRPDLDNVFDNVVIVPFEDKLKLVLPNQESYISEEINMIHIDEKTYINLDDNLIILDKVNEVIIDEFLNTEFNFYNDNGKVGMREWYEVSAVYSNTKVEV